MSNKQRKIIQQIVEISDPEMACFEVYYESRPFAELKNYCYG
jgi:hypothetical protein